MKNIDIKKNLVGVFMKIVSRSSCIFCEGPTDSRRLRG